MIFWEEQNILVRRQTKILPNQVPYFSYLSQRPLPCSWWSRYLWSLLLLRWPVLGCPAAELPQQSSLLQAGCSRELPQGTWVWKAQTGRRRKGREWNTLFIKSNRVHIKTYDTRLSLCAAEAGGDAHPRLQRAAPLCPLPGPAARREPREALPAQPPRRAAGKVEEVPRAPGPRTRPLRSCRGRGGGGRRGHRRGSAPWLSVPAALCVRSCAQGRARGCGRAGGALAGGEGKGKERRPLPQRQASSAGGRSRGAFPGPARVGGPAAARICLTGIPRAVSPPLCHRSHIPRLMQLGNGWGSQNPAPYKSSIETNVLCLQLRAEQQPVVESCSVIGSERPGQPAEAHWPGPRSRRRVGSGSGSEQGEGCCKNSRSLVAT